MKPVFIYALLDPRTDETRYVGQTPDPDRRLRQHIKDAKKYHYHSARWVCSLSAKGLKPVMKILDVVPDSEADFWEIEYIQNFRERGFDLTNFFDGGSVSWRGKKHSPETRAKIKAARSKQVMPVGEKHPSFGKKVSPESRAKMSAARVGKKSHWLGKKHSSETRAKISASLMGNTHSAEAKAKISAWHLGKKLVEGKWVS